MNGGRVVRREYLLKTLIPSGLSDLLGLYVAWLSFPSFFVLVVVDYLWPIWDRERRAVHDMLADTRVIRNNPGAAATD
jgi:RDD family